MSGAAMPSLHQGRPLEDQPPTAGMAALRRSLVWSALTGTPLERRLDRFLVRRVLGRGGMGLVLEAHDDVLQRPVALKLLRRRDPGERERARLLDEARSLARVVDPHVVHVYEVGTVEGCPFIVMELVRGQTLAAWQRERPRPWRRCVELYVQAGRGLAAAHAQGLVHRDFKPDNCIVDEGGRVRVLDFGLARADEGASSERAPSEQAPREQAPSEQAPREQASGHAEPEAAPGTSTTRGSGTLEYMAPEQLRGRGADARSDQFALCVALFEAVWGRRPFDATSPSQRAQEIERARGFGPARGGRSAGPRWLQRALARGMAALPEERFESMAELLAALERGLGRRARWRAGALLVAMAMGGAAAASAWPTPDPCARDREASVWTPAERDATERALRDHGRATTWEAIAPRLDAFAAGWQAQRVEACEARHAPDGPGPQVYARRLACLDDRRRHLAALLRALSVDEGLVPGVAATGPQALPDLDDCARIDRLLRGPGEAPAAIAEPVDAARRRVAAALAAGAVGRQREGLAQIDPVVDGARDLGWAPLHAQALAARGHLRLQARRYAGAQADLEHALRLAEPTGDDALAFDLLALQVDLAVQVGRPEAARAFWGMEQAKLERLGDDGPRALRLERQRGKVALLELDAEGAVAAFERVLEGERARHEPPAIELVDAHLDLAVGLEAAGRLDEALAHYHEGLEAAGTLLADHPDTAHLHLDLAELSFRRGDAATARVHYERALAAYAASAIPGDAFRTTAHVGLAQLELAEGDVAAAAEHARAADRSASADPDGLLGAALRADAHALLGSVEQLQGRYDDAIARYEQAIAVRRAASEADPAWVALLESNIGECELLVGRDATAERRFVAALAVLERALPPDDPRLSYPLRGLGEARLGQGDVQAGIAALERALRLRLAEPGDRESLGSIRWGLARALERGAPGRRDEALALARAAQDDLAALGPTGQERADEIARWISTIPPPARTGRPATKEPTP